MSDDLVNYLYYWVPSLFIYVFFGWCLRKLYQIHKANKEINEGLLKQQTRIAESLDALKTHIIKS